MRFNPLVKKIFSDDLIEIEIVTEKEIEKRIKTTKLLVNINVIAKTFRFFSSKGDTEAVCLLIGKISGEYLIVSDIFCCHNAKATSTNVKIPPESFCKALENNDGNYIIGWSHSHPNFRVFMSGTDLKTQTDFQNLFPDAVAMVMNPFGKNCIAFKFFRYNEDGDLKTLKYDYMVSGDEE
jgi:proteasome lid subunit RPN8/RPN11